MRYAARTDANQESIVKALRAAGASVQILAAVGKGCPDLLVGYGGPPHRYNFLLEVKDPAQPPSKRALTEDQVRWHMEWRGQVRVVETAEAALAVIGAAP